MDSIANRIYFQWSHSHKALRERSWCSGRIIVGRNDNSVNVEKLVKDSAPQVLRELPNEKKDDTRMTDFRILDIEEN